MKKVNFIFIILLFFTEIIWAEEKDIWNLQEVVVTATKTPHLLKDVPVNTVVITKEEIEMSSAQTISDILRYVPGIFVRNEDAPGISGWRTTIRGLKFNEGYGLILLDGQRVKGGGMGEYGIGLNQIPPQMIEKIEIVKGPSSVLYGSDALAGVVNIITKSAPDKPIYGFEAAVGNHNTNWQYIYWGTKKDSFGILLQAVREESNMGKYGFRNYRDEFYKKNAFNSKLSYELTKNITFNLKLSAQQEDRKRVDNKKHYTRYGDDTKYRIAPQIKITFNDKSELLIQGYYYDWDFKTTEHGVSGFTPRNGDMYYKNVEARYTKSFLSNHLFTLGTEYLQEKLDYNLSHKKLHLISGYIQDETEFSVGIPLVLVLGARLDHHSKYKTEFCPKGSFMLVFNRQQIRVRGSVGRGFKSPTIRQAYYEEPFQHGNYWYKSNPDLEAETSWGYSLGIEHSISKKLLYNITLFRNDIKNKIVRVETDEKINDLPVKTYKNVEKAYTQGIEASLKMAIIEDLLWLNMGYTYMKTKNKETGKELPYVPRHNLAAHIVFNYSKIGITMDIGTQLVSKMYKDVKNNKETENYNLVDIKLIKKLAKNISMSIEGNNIFNSDYGEPENDWWGATWLARLKIDF